MTKIPPISEEQFQGIKRQFLQQKMVTCQVVSDSMEPIIMTGDMITVALPTQPLRLFDILVFYQNKKLICHLFVKESQLSKDEYLTSSYNGIVFDFPVKASEVLGVVVSHRLSFFQKIGFLLKMRWRKNQ